MYEGPGYFAPLKEWEDYLRRLEAIPDRNFIVESVIQDAKRWIEHKRNESYDPE